MLTFLKVIRNTELAITLLSAPSASSFGATKGGLWLTVLWTTVVGGFEPQATFGNTIWEWRGSNLLFRKAQPGVQKKHSHSRHVYKKNWTVHPMMPCIDPQRLGASIQVTKWRLLRATQRGMRIREGSRASQRVQTWYLHKDIFGEKKFIQALLRPMWETEPRISSLNNALS